MSDRDFKSLYAFTEGFGADFQILNAIVNSIGTLSELTRLVEIRVLELENSPPAKDVDDRSISVLIGDKWVESK